MLSDVEFGETAIREDDPVRTRQSDGSARRLDHDLVFAMSPSFGGEERFSEIAALDNCFCNPNVGASRGPPVTRVHTFRIEDESA